MSGRLIPGLVVFLGLLIPALAAAGEAGPRVLQPGNTVVLVIPDPEPIEQKLVVDPEGAIPLGRYGRLVVAGQSLAAAEGLAREKLARFIRDANRITLNLVDARFYVFVTGQVAQSGFVRVSPGETIWQAVQRAGDKLKDADLSRVQLARGGRERGVDLQAFLAGQGAAPPKLEPGDAIFVPGETATSDASGRVALLARKGLTGKVFVVGAVTRPGLYDRPEEGSLVTALALAGGPVAHAALAGARLLTPRGSYAVDLAAAFAGRPAEVPLLPPDAGAILFVPHGRAGDPDPYQPQINVIGGVKRPGRYPLNGTVSLVEALSIAGGPTEKATLDEVNVLREGRGYTLNSRYDLEALLEEGGVAARVRLAAGDTVAVGQSDFDGWRAVVQIVSDVAVISAALLIFSGATN